MPLKGTKPIRKRIAECMYADVCHYVCRYAALRCAARIFIMWLEMNYKGRELRVTFPACAEAILMV